MGTTKCLGCIGDFDNSITTVCPHCGYDQNAPAKEAYHLMPGTILKGRYLVGKSIGSGGFGITYIAWDALLDKRIAIKEYFPSELATRMHDATTVFPYDDERADFFQKGLDRFLDEARRLAKLNTLPNIVHVYDMFGENGTAYIIMDYVDGITLYELMLQNGGALPYQDVINLMVPVLNVLQMVHDHGIIHRDIAPDNIKYDGNEITLLDFGAARTETARNSKSLSVIIKAGYAPEEQYRSSGVQGPWTDVYAVAAVMYHLITGKRPPESIERNVNDEIKTPTELGFQIPKNAENAIMNALNVKAEYRIQSAKEFADALSGFVHVERVIVKQKHDSVQLSKTGKIVISALSVVTAVLVVVIALSSYNVKDTADVDSQVIGNYEDMKKDDVFKAIDDLNEEYDCNIDYEIVGTIEREDVAEGEEVIVWQDLDQGTPVQDIQKIELKIATPPIKKYKMPLLMGNTRSQAEKALKKAGFENYTFKEKESREYSKGLVCEQSIAQGKKIKYDQKITVYIAKAAPTTQTTRRQNNTTTKKHTTTKKQTTTRKQTTTTKKNSSKSWELPDETTDAVDWN